MNLELSPRRYLVKVNGTVRAEATYNEVADPPTWRVAVEVSMAIRGYDHSGIVFKAPTLEEALAAAKPAIQAVIEAESAYGDLSAIFNHELELARARAEQMDVTVV